MEYTGERIVPTAMAADVINYQLHLERYIFAMGFCVDKTVIDAACGTGYGLALISDVTSDVWGADISESALDYAALRCPKGTFIRHDFESEQWDREFDVCISFETIEHLRDPSNFLSNIKNTCRELIYSIPINCKTSYHLVDYSEREARSLMINHFGEHRYLAQGYVPSQGIRDGFPSNNEFLVGHVIII